MPAAWYEAVLDRDPVPDVNFCMTVPPDTKVFLYRLMGGTGADLMLVETFR